MGDVSQFRIKRVDAQNPKVWAQLVQMDTKSFDDSAPPLTDNSGAWWIAYHGKAPAGFASIKQSASSSEGGYMHRAGVLPSYRGNGLQKILIKRRLAYAKEQGWKWVVTDTAHNPASGNSLISCGFKLFSPAIPWSFTYACYWRKYIKP